MAPVGNPFLRDSFHPSGMIPVIFIVIVMAGNVPPLWAQSLDLTPPRPEGPAKIQNSLWDLAATGQAAAKPTDSATEDTVVVTLVPYPGTDSASIDTSSFTELGVQVLARSRSLIRVSVPASSLLAVSELPGVGFVRRPHRPHSLATLSEGAARIGAVANHRAGVSGRGTKVAVIDVGFRGADRLPEDMPESWRYRDYTDEGIYAGDEHPKHRHGTACAEIVYDVAPDAGLYLLKVDDLVGLENSKDLCIREGIDMVSHSLSWLGTGFGDGLGLACDIVNDAADNGILWVNAAGNSADSHYTGLWSDSDFDGWHNFANENDDELLNVQATAGDSIQVILTWDDFPTTAEDYNLHLFFIDTLRNCDQVDKSTTIQNGLGSDPVEWINYIVERSGEYGIAVRKLDGARAKSFKIWSYNQEFEEYSVARNSIGIPADARGAMAVGAVYHGFWNLGLIEEYSSRGPSTDGRIKPELVAPTGVSTVSYGRTNIRQGGGYFGTSAAAPHVAGAAALIKSANPSFSRTDLWDALPAATVDIGNSGKDNDSGYGKLELPVMQIATSPRITSVSPSRVRYNQVVTIRGAGFGANRGTGRVIFHQGKGLSPSRYVSWSDTRIQVRIPTGARTGNLQVVTANGNDTFRLTITSPWVRSISPRSGRSNTLVTVTGSNFGSSRGSSSVRIGFAAIPSFTTWSNSRIQFRIPVNTRSGHLSVRTSEGTSNTVFLEVTSPYLSRVSPTRVEPGDRLTLTGAKFRTTRGAGYVLFSPNVRPASGDYVTWSDRRIVVEVPSRAESGNVKVVTLYGSSGNRRIEVEREELEPLPSTGIFGYDPPGLTKNPKRVRFGFEGIGEDVAMTWTLKNDSDIDVLVNGRHNLSVEKSDDWKSWWTLLSQADLHSGRNVIEFRNRSNQNRSSSFTRWQLKDVKLWKPFSAKPIAGATFLGPSRPVPETALGDPFPTPFNASVTVPFTTAAAGQVRISLFNLMGQQVRVLHDGWTGAGEHQAYWDGRSDSGTEAASGIYWALLRTEQFAQSTRLVLIR